MKRILKCWLTVTLGFAVASCSKDSKESSLESSVHSIVDSGHKGVQLWEDGPYWAETNIGAEKPEDGGYYFWWGDVIGHRHDGNGWVARDGSKSSFGICPTNDKDIDALKREGWITENGVLTPKHDAAHMHWGGKWRMPTKQELDDLESKCDWTAEMMNGENGYVVRGKGDYASNSIFLPDAGYGKGTSLCRYGSHGAFWSSVPGWKSYHASSLSLNSPSDHYTYDSPNDHHYTHDGSRNFGRSVRPVQGPVTAVGGSKFPCRNFGRSVRPVQGFTK